MLKPAFHKILNLVNTPSLLGANHFPDNDSDIINWNLLSLDNILKVFEKIRVQKTILAFSISDTNKGGKGGNQYKEEYYKYREKCRKDRIFGLLPAKIIYIKDLGTHFQKNYLVGTFFLHF